MEWTIVLELFAIIFVTGLVVREYRREKKWASQSPDAYIRNTRPNVSQYVIQWLAAMSVFVGLLVYITQERTKMARGGA